MAKEITRMYRGTTPTISIKLKTELDLEQIKEVYVTFKTAYSMITKGKSDIMIDSAEKKLEVMLTQEDTLALQQGVSRVQVRILLENGLAYASKIVETPVNAILLDGKIGDDNNA